MLTSTRAHDRRLLGALFALLAEASAPAYAQTVADLDPRVRVTVTGAPSPAITLRWNASSVAGGYLVRRRDPSATGWESRTMRAATATEHGDRGVQVGLSYADALRRPTVAGQTSGQGLSAGAARSGLG